jgi:lysozyme family protein
MAAIKELQSTAREARSLGVVIDDLDALDDASAGYDRWMRALIDLVDALGEQADRGDKKAGDLSERADQLAADLLNEERAKGEAAEGAEEATRALGMRYEQVSQEYQNLFETCVVRPEFKDQVAWHVKKIVSRQDVYERLAGKVDIPWYFIAIIHCLEASFRFNGHLHNGDPLTARTVQVPKNRPPVWNPPNDWDSSAVDALTYEGFAGQKDWSIPRMLFRWETYNGWGYRSRGINTPYLWSFSNHYSRGKFVKDGVYDPMAMSKQCGAAVMLRALMKEGVAAIA